MNLHLKPALALVAPMMLLSTSLFAQQQAPDPCKDTAQSPSGASLTLALKNRQASFREGEIIALTLAYTSTAADTYQLSTRNYDRSGRLNAETFCIEPVSGRDPLDDYFNGLFAGFIGGGLGGMQMLSPTPALIDIELNEWKALPPGRYQLRLVSNRVQRQAAAGETEGSLVRVPLRSNIIEFQVVPATPDWQVAQLDSAIKILDTAIDQTSKQHAARVLRFLGSEAATRELAKRYVAMNDPSSSTDLKFGLIGSPHRQVVIGAMKAAITDPQSPITNDFLETLSLLEVQARSEYVLPPFSEANRAAWNAARERKLEVYRATIALHMSELSRALPAKNTTAFATSVNTVLAAAPASADRAGLQQMLQASWDSLPVRTRNELIAYRWKDIGGPGMLPILRRMVTASRNPRIPEIQPERGPALSRIYELAPDEGRDLILKEILNTKGDVGMDVLGFLPDRELPQIEEPLLEKIRTSNATSVDYQLIERYATARPLAEMKTVFEKSRGKWACDPQKAFLNYFLRVDRAYGTAQVADALQQRQATGCYRTLLSDLKSAIEIPELEQLAIAALDDSSAEVARSAAEALGRYGSLSAEEALWKRMERFHATWRDRANELRSFPGGANPEASAAASLEYFLINALTQGRAWVADADKLERLKGLVSPSRQNELTSLISEWQPGPLRLFLNWTPEGELHYGIARYSGNSVKELSGKISQLPSGTRIALSLSSSDEAAHRAEIDAVRDAARAAGAILEITLT